MKVYLVGGAVRDSLLGKAVKDKDYVVVGATPEEMLEKGYLQVGKDFPVFLHPETRNEYALARTERKSGTGYKGFTVHASPEVTLEEDLKRRDISINAMAQDEDGHIIDPCGGQQDLENKLLRHTTSAFSEDPLRVLRVARFHARLAAMNFKVAPETMSLLEEMSASGELNHLVAERVWTEIVKALMEEQPSQFFLTLKECGALQVLLPEVDRLFGVPQRKDYHPEIDTGVHTMMVVDRAAQLNANADVRFAALVHDLGKADTPEDVLPKHLGHEKRSLKHIKEICHRYKAPKSYQVLALFVAEFHSKAHKAFELKPASVVNMLERMDVFRNSERFQSFLLACKADSQGRLGCENNEYPQADYLWQCFKACKKVNAKPFVEKGLLGPAIAEAVRQERLKIVRQIKTDFLR